APQCPSVDQHHSNAWLAISSLFGNPEQVSRFFFTMHLSTEMRGGMRLSPTVALFGAVTGFYYGTKSETKNPP
ncbi:MAG TPA: hypothetical protein VKI44_42230, partial [Acetobacteraceae bacterium]|nr:hypothetical protein [Acetobacteraceae bacterium]